jgi:hypothetical protein
MVLGWLGGMVLSKYLVGRIAGQDKGRAGRYRDKGQF